MRTSGNKPEEASQFELQLTLAGYDTDGKARIVWSTLKIDPSLNPEWLASVQESGEQVVSGKKLTIVIRGVRQVAENIIANPESYAADKAISRYQRSKDSGEFLSTEDMKELGRALARETAAHSPGVGGANQIAVLRRGSSIELDQMTFPPENPRTISFVFVTDGIFDPLPNPIGPASGRTNLFIHNDFRGDTILLDGSYFAANTFKNCLIVYRGGRTIFAASQDVSTSILAVGNEVNRRSETASHLINDFHWASITAAEASKRATER